MNVSVWLQQRFGRLPEVRQGSDRIRWLVWGTLACLAVVVLWPDLAALFRTSPVVTPAAVRPAPAPPVAPPPVTMPPPVPAPASLEPLSALTQPLPPAQAPDGAAMATDSQPPAPSGAAATQPSDKTRRPAPIRQAPAPTAASQAETLYRKGMLLLRQGRSPEAESLLEQTLQIEPGHGWARQALASIRIEAGRMLETEALLQQGLQLAPAETAWALLLARLQVERGDRQAAIRTLSNSLGDGTGLARRDAAPHAFLAALLQQQGQHAVAITHFGFALRLEPDRGVWWMGLGISLQADGQIDRAAAAYRRALNGASLPVHLRAFVEERLQQVSP